jgi:hypothetical protein
MTRSFHILFKFRDVKYLLRWQKNAVLSVMALPGLTWNLCKLVCFIQIYNVSTEMKAEFVPRQKVGRVLFLCHALCEGTSLQNSVCLTISVVQFVNQPF